uniref:ABC transporter domain-containing protein n=1 Tax=Kalanchoe fedtschenkoi TaxID=63787 RepID=A0A7N0VH06_KALFE
MAEGHASFWTQADALLRKSLTFQKSNLKANIKLVVIPFLLILCVFLIQLLLDIKREGETSICVCDCIYTSQELKCETKCPDGFEDPDAVTPCPIPKPPIQLPLIQVPSPESRAVKNDLFFSIDFPDETCRKNGTCPAVVLLSGNDPSLGESLGKWMFTSYSLNFSDSLGSLGNNVLVEITCAQGLPLWRNSSAEVNNVLYKGYWRGNSERKVNEILAAYDFSNSNRDNFNITILYNSTFSADEKHTLLRIPRLTNMISNAYLQFLKGPGTRMPFQFVKEMPMPALQPLEVDITSALGPIIYTWVVLMLFPVILSALVYEKQQKLRIMMKMHGLGDGPYWLISYAYFLLMSSVYLSILVASGSVLEFGFFTKNSYSVQFVFYFMYANLQISLAFLMAAFFSDVKTATVLGYVLVFGTGLLGFSVFNQLMLTASGALILLLELYPGFSLYRGLWELARHAIAGRGLMWERVMNGKSAMGEVVVIMFLEWLVMLFLAYYSDQTIAAGSGVPRSPLFFLRSFSKKTSLQRHASKAPVQTDKPDVQQEVEKVQQLLQEQNLSDSIIVDNLKKIYPGRDGNPEKYAVKGLSLAIPSGECFGMLGPNGAGKTSFISMMIGLTIPTSGNAYIEQMDIQTQMDSVYTKMGVCPQNDLLWETLTGREHLLFYGRLKNLKGAALHQAVEESLRGLNLLQGGFADKPAGKYSGGMKRRLSVAISLIGDPKVVYMDEPSTGLDPASRNSLWKVVKQAKQGRAIILTTHSMEEAEHLCDRLGIFVDGSLQCVGNPKELKARFGGSYVFTMTTASEHEEEVERLAMGLSPNAKRVYHLSGTQKFELPKHEVNMADVFSAVEDAKSQFAVQAWGIADTTLEDVFIKVASVAQIFKEDPS